MPIPVNSTDGFQFDLETKLFQPTKLLLQVIETKLSLLYQIVREALIQAHETVAKLGLQLYEQPMDTIAAWFNQAVAKSEALATIINTEIIPSLNLLYQSNLRNIKNYSEKWSNKIQQSAIEANEFWVKFYDDPLAVSEKIYDNVATSLTQYSTVSLEWLEQFKSAIISIYQSSLLTLNIFLDAPQATLENLYIQFMAGILNLYYSLISNAMELLGDSLPAIA